MSKGFSLDERIHMAVQFSLTAIDTPERRARIIADVRRAIGNTRFEKTLTTSMDGEPLVSAHWGGDELIVEIVKPEPPPQPEVVYGLATFCKVDNEKTSEL